MYAFPVPVMVFPIVPLFTLLFAYVSAEDLLFLQTAARNINTTTSYIPTKEWAIAQKIGLYTIKVVNTTEWGNMTTAKFASYKAIVMGDSGGNWDSDGLFGLLNATKQTWSPAVKGNMLIVGRSTKIPVNTRTSHANNCYCRH
jgi:hypothetical protein